MNSTSRTRFLSFILSLPISVLFFVSCKKDKLENEKSLLEGNWKWIYTSHTYGWCNGEAHYDILEPVNEHSISFAEKGKITFNKNGQKEGKYRIVFNHFVYLQESTYAFQLKLDNDTAQIIEGVVSPDTMNIKYPYVESDPNCENYLNFFVRE